MKPHRIGFDLISNQFYVARRATETEPEKIESKSDRADDLFEQFDLLED
jgi:hypothetical protein